MVPPPTALTYSELYADTSKNPFGEEEEERDICYGAIYKVRRATHAPLTSEALLQNILADFSRPIGGIGMFVPGGDSPTGIFKLLRDITSFPGNPGHSRDWVTVFGYEGSVTGVDMSTMTFLVHQLKITPDEITTGPLARDQQMLSEEPNHQTLGTFNATDVNMRMIKAQTMPYTPFELLEPLLGTELMAHQVFQLIVINLLDSGL
jgi:hypothetical protein